MLSCTELTKNFRQHGCVCHKPEFHSITRRVNTDLSRRGFLVGAAASASVFSALGLPTPATSSISAWPPSYWTAARLEFTC